MIIKVKNHKTLLHADKHFMSGTTTVLLTYTEALLPLARYSMQDIQQITQDAEAVLQFQFCHSVCLRILMVPDVCLS